VSADELSREQEAYVDDVASRFGAAQVIRLPGIQRVMVRGWVSGVDGEGGVPADGSAWEWLDGDGSHGPVDEGAAAPLEQRASKAAGPPGVPGPTREGMARKALCLIAEHWPDDLRGVSMRAVEPGLWAQGAYRNGAEVALLGTPDGVPLGLILRFAAADLRGDARVAVQAIVREHREWARNAAARRAGPRAAGPEAGG
jgi:hypothetical protein